MSLIIFFGMALIIFLGGMTIISVTVYHLYKENRERKRQIAQNQAQANPAN